MANYFVKKTDANKSQPDGSETTRRTRNTGSNEPDISAAISAVVPEYGPIDPETVLPPGEFTGFKLPSPESTTNSYGLNIKNKIAPPAGRPPNLNDPDNTNNLSDLISAGVSPELAERIRRNRERRIALDGMPTYDENGMPVRPDVKDTNGRMKSGLKAMIAQLAEMSRYPAVSMNDIYGRLAGAASAGVTGAIVPEWDERVDREKEKIRLDQEYQNLTNQAEWESRMQTAGAARQATLQKPEIERLKMEQRARISEQNNLTRQYNSLPSYDEHDADDHAFGDYFQKVFGFRPLGKNAKTRSQQMIDNRDGQVYLLQTDEQGKEKVIRLLTEDKTPFRIQSNQMLASADRANQRKLEEKLKYAPGVTEVRISDLNANSRVGGATQFNRVETIRVNKAKYAELLKSRSLAQTNNQEAKTALIDAQIASAKTNAKALGLTDEEIREIFGEN